MKLALVIKTFSRRAGGAEGYSVNLAEELSRRGIETHVFAHRWSEPVPDGVVVHHVPMIGFSSLFKIATFPWFASRRINRNDFDAVVGLTPLFSQDVYRVGEGLHPDVLRSRYPSLGKRLARYANPKHLLILALERRLFSPDRTAAVITNSALVRERVIRLYGYPPARVHALHNGVDRERFAPRRESAERKAEREGWGIAEDVPALLFIANDFERKGLRTLVDALGRPILKNAPWRLIVVGKDRPASYRRRAESLGIADRFVFLGTSDRMDRIYAAGDCLVLPTLYDPFANVCIEAMASGLPVITTRANGASELITDGCEGWVIGRADDLAGLARRIADVLRNRAWEEMGRRARHRVESLSWAAHADRFLSVVESLDKENGRTLTETNASAVNLWIDPAAHPTLSRHGLDSLDGVMGFSGGEEFKRKESRTVTRAWLQEGDRRTQIYIKRHRGDGDSGARREWENILLFREASLPTLEPLAFGEGERSGEKVSFLITRGLSNATWLDLYMKEHFCRPIKPDAIRRKREILCQVAGLARRMHDAGYIHRDLNLAHIFVEERPDGALEYTFIDLGRVVRRPLRFRRWVIRDLATFDADLKPAYATRSDRLRLYLAYSGVSGLEDSDKRMIRRILRKSRRIAARDRRRLERAGVGA